MSGPSPQYLAQVRELSDRVVEAQRPIRVLDSIKWHRDLREAFFASGCRELPRVDVDYYRERNPLDFDTAAKRGEFREIERDIARLLGQLNPVSVLMRRICREYRTVVDLLEARGTPEFGLVSRDLYGSASDVFHAGDPTLADLGTAMEDTLVNLLRHDSMAEEEKTITAEQAVEMLNERLLAVFPDAGIRVLLNDQMTADAAAGSDYLKIRSDARFNQLDIDVLEVHEGWVHLGTTLNGSTQPYCTFLGKGPPSSTTTQEGLAVLTEILTLRSSPARLYKLVNRVRAVTLAEEGANFVEVFDYLCTNNLSPQESYSITTRVFRGSTADGRPFTKDLAYMRGFVQTFNFLRLAMSEGKLDSLPLLFLGKVTLEDLKLYRLLLDEGVVTPPRFLPPHFAQMKGLATWMSFSRFIASLNFDQLQADYSGLL
ncbi:flavohemoglobin expression-modulating QEGLA motif protein [Mangrovimicrobium sediminis]|uniref:Flavohemoglobin expression-modulating QEGLA motif protein n=1 Tax=Mangrovimicrobium sediminis TaxID=2562682 RepID=A0A4Z0LWB1_9GAMM|nr:flavohemoglobin expression-modulating QEGLA motif protein [Haliea sp. SAOS-164]TGD71612.1 flavohemoglobin expression-modulating QEGLA motif protein [Haliea sp. SAOS-164]